MAHSGRRTRLVAALVGATAMATLLADGLEQIAEAPLAQQAGTSSDYPLGELFGADVLAALEPDVAYHLRGLVADSDGTRYTHGATFTLAEVAAFADGEVSGNAVEHRMPRAAFARQACAEEGDSGTTS